MLVSIRNVHFAGTPRWVSDGKWRKKKEVGILMGNAEKEEFALFLFAYLNG